MMVQLLHFCHAAIFQRSFKGLFIICSELSLHGVVSVKVM